MPFLMSVIELTPVLQELGRELSLIKQMLARLHNAFDTISTASAANCNSDTPSETYFQPSPPKSQLRRSPSCRSEPSLISPHAGKKIKSSDMIQLACIMPRLYYYYILRYSGEGS